MPRATARGAAVAHAACERSQQRRAPASSGTCAASCCCARARPEGCPPRCCAGPARRAMGPAWGHVPSSAQVKGRHGVAAAGRGGGVAEFGLGVGFGAAFFTAVLRSAV
eukprot:4160259-Prymnesium_polylepis.1